MPETGPKIPPEAAFERFVREKHERGEKKYEHISGRIAAENLPSDHLYRWIAEWMNLQLSDVGVTSTGGVALPPLHFELVRVNNGIAAAHTFEAVAWGFIVMTQPMFDEMLRLSRLVSLRTRPSSACRSPLPPTQRKPPDSCS